MKKIIFATNNEGKLKEFRDLVSFRSWCVYSLKDRPEIVLPEETGVSFRENAEIKARAAAQAAGMIAVADDSGLEVDFLGGEPGVFSARFAGEHGNDFKNNEKLLTLLDGVPEEKRTACFRCVIAVSLPFGETFFCQGVCKGLITLCPRGNNGFGYDPLFWLPSFGRTMAELSMEEKNQISHRGKAFRAALPLLEKLLG
ncbi:MAG: XTP/dITP diphosphatase [Bacillota bacterium]|jgi:XTP/dITP diphosphohydrolase|nr:XTP/dITP diphosphatase [Clostridia bacterium]